MEPIPHPPNPAIPVEEERVWIDGCFDFAHHGTHPPWPQPNVRGSMDTDMDMVRRTASG